MRALQWAYTRTYHALNHPRVRALAARLVPFRAGIIFGTHALLFAAAYFCAVLLVFGGIDYTGCIEALPYTLFPLMAVKLLVFSHYDLFQGMWRFVSFEDLMNIVRASLIGSTLFFVAGALWPRLALAEQVVVADFILTVVLTGGTRMLVRNIRENFVQTHIGAPQSVLLVGPVGTVLPLVKEMLGNPNSDFRPLAIIDPEKTERFGPARVSDVPVYSLAAAFPRLNRLKKVHAIMLCWPRATRAQIADIVDRLKDLNAPFNKLPDVEDLLSGKAQIRDVREVEIQDLLERPPVNTDMAAIGASLKGKVVLVSGGGGSIGSELCHQIAAFEPRRLVVVERSENSLYPLQSALRERFPDLDLVAPVSTINNRPGMEALMRRTGVEVVFHAAAYKHVPLMETAVIEAAYNNIVGTCNLAKSAQTVGVQRFVMVSTDKAVNPTNIMGVTKRVAEMVVQSLNGRGPTQFITVRFGNVLGSAGSVIPIFKEQLLQGQPLTVTDPEIERFFMTIPEAVQLVLQAGCLGRGGNIYVLDMGQPVKILKLAEKLITLAGKRPYKDVEIRFTGLRPGEKMYEELFTESECLVSTDHPRIRVAACEHVEQHTLMARVEQIVGMIHGQDERGLIRAFMELAPAYRPSEEIRGRLFQLGREEKKKTMPEPARVA